MLCYVMSCHVMLCYVILYYIISCHVTLSVYKEGRGGYGAVHRFCQVIESKKNRKKERKEVISIFRLGKYDEGTYIVHRYTCNTVRMSSIVLSNKKKGKKLFSHGIYGSDCIDRNDEEVR